MSIDKRRVGKINFRPIVFEAYNRPLGWLEPIPACHGLMYYSLVAKNAYEEVTKSPVLIGDKDPHADFRQLFKSIAFLYGCEPETMANFWPSIRLQWMQLGLTAPPDIVVRATELLVRADNSETESQIGFVSLKELEEKGKLTDDLKKFGIDVKNMTKQ